MQISPKAHHQQADVDFLLEKPADLEVNPLHLPPLGILENSQNRLFRKPGEPPSTSHMDVHEIPILRRKIMFLKPIIVQSPVARFPGFFGCKKKTHCRLGALRLFDQALSIGQGRQWWFALYILRSTTPSCHIPGLWVIRYGNSGSLWTWTNQSGARFMSKGLCFPCSNALPENNT